jgi:diadenosine tetraphosphate (Ap4A) HIT family hydrolase
MMAVSGKPPYDQANIFGKIFRGEIPCKKIYEDEFVLAFHDINPQAPVHALVVPKGDFVSAADFGAHAPAALVVGFHRAIAHVAKQLGLEETGYRLISNMGWDSHQEVPHYHVHILGGRKLGVMLATAG